MNIVYLVFLGLTWVGIECLIGGTRLIFSLPNYGILALGSILTLAGIWRKRPAPDPFCILSTLLLGAWVLFRSSHSPVQYLALPDFFMMIGCLITYLLTAYYLSGAGQQAALIFLLWAIAAAEVWVGMVQFGKDKKFMLFGFLRPPYERASGMYISPNNFAGFLATVAILSISIGVWSRWRMWVKILAFYIAAGCLLGVAISGSRGGYFAAIGCLVTFGLACIYIIRIVEPRKFLPVAVGAGLGVAGVVGLAAFLMGHSDFLTHRMQTMVVKDVRIYNWEAAIDHIRLSPWVGTGAGTHLIYGRLFRRPEIQADPVHAHCDYLELLAEYGIVGGLCMALFLTAHIRRGLRSFSVILRRRLIPSGLHRSNRLAIQLGALCAVAGLAVHSVVDFDMHIPGNALIFAFLFGVLANPDLEIAPGLAARFLPWGKILLPALGVLMLWRGMPLLPSEYCAEMARQALRDGKYLLATYYAQKGIGAPLTRSLPASEPAQPLFLDTLLSKAGPNPANPDLYFYLGEANRALGERMKINPFMQRRYYGEAAQAFAAGLRVFPQDENLMVRYAQTLDGLRQFNDAEGVYQDAMKWDPKLGKIQELYEAHLIAEGRKAEAEQLARARLQKKTVVVDFDQSLIP